MTAIENTHLAILLSQQNKVAGLRVLDLAGGDCRPLAKELAWRAVAVEPHLAGRPWQPSIEIESAESSSEQSTGRVLLSAWLQDNEPRLAARVAVPANNFAMLGLQLGESLGLEAGSYNVHLATLPADHACVAQAANTGDDDFHVADSTVESLHFPSDFSTEPLGRRRGERRLGTFFRCVFTPAAWNAFLSAASRETEVERGWAARVQVHLFDGACHLLIEDELCELPAEAARHQLRTRGRDFLALYRQWGPRLAAYLHLHPPSVEAIELGPYPSGPDTTLACNVDAGTPLPVVLPIALFGARGSLAGGDRIDVAAHAFLGGVLTEIDLEVLA